MQSFSKIGQHWYYTFYKGSPFDVFWFFNLPKIQRGDPYKISNINVVQSCWNFAQLSKIKNKQVAKIWGLYLKKQKIGATISSPESLENTPIKMIHCRQYLRNLNWISNPTTLILNWFNVVHGLDQKGVLCAATEVKSRKQLCFLIQRFLIQM